MAISTMRDFMNAVIEANFSAEATEFASNQIEKMDATNEKRRAKAAQKAEAYMGNVRAFVDVLTDTPQTATQLVNAVQGILVREDNKAITPQYIARLAKVAVDQGWVVRESVKVEGEKGAKVGYRLA